MLHLKANTQWRKVQDRLEDDERCSRLEKIDRLEIFQVSASTTLSCKLTCCFVCSLECIAGVHTRPGEGRSGAEKDTEGINWFLFSPLPLSKEDILTFCILKIKEQIRRLERKNRDEFRKLMEGHIATGVLTAKTHWRDYCMQVLSESWSVYNYIQNL